MTQEPAPRSDCCNAEMGVSLSYEGTNYHFCMKCKKPCDALTANAVPREWWEKLKEHLENETRLCWYGNYSTELLDMMRRIEQGEE